MRHYTDEELRQMRSILVTRYPRLAHIMVCIPTYAASAGKAPAVLSALSAQIHPDFEVVLLDTTPASGGRYDALPQLVREHLNGIPTTILTTTLPAGSPKRRIIAEGREQLRQHFLQSGAPLLFFLDDDVVLPPDALAVLAAHAKPVMVGVYLNPMILREGHAPEIAPCIWIDLPRELGRGMTTTAGMTRMTRQEHGGLAPRGETRASEPSTDEAQLDEQATHTDERADERTQTGEQAIVRPVQIIEAMPGRIMKVGISGFGCSLFTRDVMAGTAFTYDPKSTITEDTPFFIDLERRGILSFCDTSVKCWHLKFPPDDKRNDLFDFDHYRLRFVP